MSTLPETLVIGPFDFVVDRSPKKGNFGNCDSANLRISVTAEGPAQIHNETLLHEALHAVWRIYGVPCLDHEEEIIGTLAPALMALFRFNPELKDVLFGELA